MPSVDHGMERRDVVEERDTYTMRLFLHRLRSMTVQYILQTGLDFKLTVQKSKSRQLIVSMSSFRQLSLWSSVFIGLVPEIMVAVPRRLVTLPTVCRMDALLVRFGGPSVIVFNL